jgi:hypothetical protein
MQHLSRSGNHNCTIFSEIMWNWCNISGQCTKEIKEIGAKALQQRTILFKLVDHLTEKEQLMSNRVLNRVGARNLTSEEAEKVAGGATGCRGTSLHPNGPIVDILCDPHL